MLKKNHKTTETNKFNKEKKRAILYKPAPFGTVAFGVILFIKETACWPLESPKPDGITLVNKMTNTPKSGIKIK